MYFIELFSRQSKCIYRQIPSEIFFTKESIDNSNIVASYITLSLFYISSIIYILKKILHNLPTGTGRKNETDYNICSTITGCLGHPKPSFHASVRKLFTIINILRIGNYNWDVPKLFKRVYKWFSVSFFLPIPGFLSQAHLQILPSLGPSRRRKGDILQLKCPRRIKVF